MYLAFFERKSRPCGKPCPRTLPLSNGSVFILGYGGDSKRGVGSGFRVVRLFYIRASTYPVSQ
jgi:hypothetical protein